MAETGQMILKCRIGVRRCMWCIGMYVVGRLMTTVSRLVSPLICLWCDCVVAQWADMASPLLIVPVILSQCDYRVT